MIQENCPLLSFATEEEIIEELKRRYGNIVFAYSSETPKDPTTETFSFVWKGTITVAMGLIERARTRIKHHINHLEEAADGE